MKLFLDDIRTIPDNSWTLIRDVPAVISLLEKHNTKMNRTPITHLSLDNDLGEGQIEGYKVMDWIEEMYHTGILTYIPIISVHSANPVRINYMIQIIQSFPHIGYCNYNE